MGSRWVVAAFAAALAIAPLAGAQEEEEKPQAEEKPKGEGKDHPCSSGTRARS